MNSSFYVELALYAGEILLRNGAEAFRVEDTISRILKHYDYSIVETVTTTTGIYVSVIDESGNAITLIKRVHDRTINLNNIAEVNSISRQICENKISGPTAYNQLIDVHKSATYSDKSLIIAWAICCFGFAYIPNSSLSEAFISLLVGLFTGIFATRFKANLSRITYPFIVSAFTALLAIIGTLMFNNVNMNDIIISGIMPVLPGATFVNAIRDILNGDYMCAQSRVLEVLVIAICIALGVGLVLSIYVYLGASL